MTPSFPGWGNWDLKASKNSSKVTQQGPGGIRDWSRWVGSDSRAGGRPYSSERATQSPAGHQLHWWLRGIFCLSALSFDSSERSCFAVVNNWAGFAISFAMLGLRCWGHKYCLWDLCVPSKLQTAFLLRISGRLQAEGWRRAQGWAVVCPSIHAQPSQGEPTLHRENCASQQGC